MSKKRILAAVLNWGLGHATRSIPIIQGLLRENFEVILASDGAALLFLRKEFPELPWILLPSYSISYPKNAGNFRLYFLKKSLSLSKTVFAEHRLIKKICSAQRIDGIYSDNRIGAFVEGIPSAYCTHQVTVLSGASTWITTKLHQYFIRRFSECWIPDVEGERNLSGRLGHDFRINTSVRYMGTLSRLRKRSTATKYDLMVLLSGPEPQRLYLEQKLRNELTSYSGKVLFVRGVVQSRVRAQRLGNLLIYNYLTTQLLERAVNESALVIARSGYSTILDLAVLEKKAYFIPTPGQYEQEYLAQRLRDLQIAPFSAQDEFRLEKLQEITSFTGFSGFGSGGCFDGFALFEGK